jgi:hypothetical protein
MGLAACEIAHLNALALNVISAVWVMGFHQESTCERLDCVGCLFGHDFLPAPGERLMKPLILIAAGMAFSLASPALVWSQATEPEPGFAKLFDGKTLAGWEGNAEFFRVEGDAIVAGSLQKPIPNNEFLCTTRKFGDFELRLEVRLKGQGNNAGVQFRSARVPDDHEVSGYQCDVGVAWDRPVWGGLYDESRRRKMLAEGPEDKLRTWVKEGDWNALRIKAVGDRVQLFVNGHPTVDYVERDAQIARDGIIGLQIHSGPPTEAWYRNIRIRELITNSQESKE